MDFNDNLKKLVEDKDETLSKSENLKNEKDEELAKTRENIEKKYNPKIKESIEKLKSCYDLIDEYCMTVQKYSQFNEKDIAYIITSIVRAIECLPYKYELAITRQDSMVYSNYDRIRKTLYKHLRLIVKDYINFSYPVNKNKVEDLIESNEAILLATYNDEDFSDNFPKKTIEFYSFDSENHTLYSPVKYGKFDYIKEFIDGVISYKIENNIIDISREELDLMSFNFIRSNVALTAKKRSQLEKKYETEMSKKIDNYKTYQYYIKNL